MDAVTPWPGLVKRLRFLSSLKQDELAQQLGVDQRTVSRWERGTHAPDMPVQKRLRDMLQRLEPTIAPAAVEGMPVPAILYSAEHIGLSVAASRPYADVFNKRTEEMRDLMIRDNWSESIRNMWDALTATDAWKSNDVAFSVASLYRPDQKWVRCTLMPIGGVSLLLAIGAVIPPPNGLKPDDFKLTITTKDELWA